MASKVRAGEAYVEATLDDSKLRRSLKRMEQFFGSRFPRATKTATGAVRAFGTAVATTATVATGGLALIAAGIAAIGAVTVGGIGYATAKFLEFSAEIGKLSGKAGVSVETMSELQYAARQFGAEAEDVSEAMLELRRRIAEGLSDGSGPALNGLKILGLELEKIAAMKPDQQMEAIAEAMKNLGDNDLAAFAADELFGGDAEKFLPLLMQGKEGIAALRQEARELGLVLEGEDVEAAGKLSKAFALIRSQWDAFLVQVGAAFAPLIMKAAEVVQTYLQPALKAIEGILEGVEQQLQSLIEGSSSWGEAWANLWDVFTGYGKGAVAAVLAEMSIGLSNILVKLANGIEQSGLSKALSIDFQTAGLDAAVGLRKAGTGLREDSLKGFEEGAKALERTVSLEEKRRREAPVESPSAPKSKLPATPVEAKRPAAVVPESIASAGTFSGRAASFLGKSDPVVTELKDANKSLARIEKNTREGSVFA
jgi:hypothetical protein